MAKPKTCNLSLIERDDNDELYTMLNQIIATHCPELADVKILLAFRRGIKEDKDGHVELGYAKKAGELEKELHPEPYDGVIVLNEETWTEFDTRQREALLLHEALHFSVVHDDGGDVKRDERGRVVLRMRSHDLEEFRKVVEIFGFYKKDLESFAEVCQRARENPLFAGQTDENGESDDVPRLHAVGE